MELTQPALPDVWSMGSVSGLRMKGGFEVVAMQWKNGKLEKLVVKSTLGRQCAVTRSK